MIPKTIYQTWHSKEVPAPIQDEIDEMMEINKGWKREMYDDNDIETFIGENFDSNTLNIYKRLNIGAAKADLWRYMVLYKYGGVYLDIDSIIKKPLDDLIKDDDQLIVTREGNKGFFVQWCLMCEKGNKVMEECIKECLYNIENLESNDIHVITGPTVYRNVLEKLYGKSIYYTDDKTLNDKYTDVRFYGCDYEEFADFKNKNYRLLYKDKKPWKYEQVYKNVK